MIGISAFNVSPNVIRKRITLSIRILALLCVIGGLYASLYVILSPSIALGVYLDNPTNSIVLVHAINNSGDYIDRYEVPPNDSVWASLWKGESNSDIDDLEFFIIAIAPDTAAVQLLTVNAEDITNTYRVTVGIASTR